MNNCRYFYSPDSIVAADRFVIDVMGIPAIVLMENAGRECARHACNLADEGQKVLILAGSGNNGGDGFVIARHLHRQNRIVQVITSVDPEKISGAAGINCKIAISLGICVRDSDLLSSEEIKGCMSSSDLVVDSLLGTGAKGDLRGQISRLVSLIGAAKKIMAVDGPTGVNLEDGSVSGEYVRADATVTMIAPKSGQAVNPGMSACGKLIVADIGVSARVALKDKPAITKVADSSRFKPLDDNIHKGDRGGVLIVAGSSVYPGAALLSARGALRGGAGLCVVISESSVLPYFRSLPEAIIEEVPATDSEFEKLIEKWSGRCSVAVLGPGLGREDRSEFIYKSVTEHWKGNLIIDGDGLYYLSQDSSSRTDLMITPHEGEAGRLLGWTPGKVKNNRLKALEMLSHKFGVALLKGADTLISDKSNIYVNHTGSPALSVPGSGDVLSGLCGAFVARGLNNLDAVAIAAKMHGRAGELLSSSHGVDGVLASEIADAVPDAIREIFNER